ncbi:hypothetical protein QDA01_gp38 [Microbacterium phage Cinna]|uniref:Uncharacterized protein n=1 Tax=Microbacterium phage Cinna TaxID=2591215 RepID=A0A514DDF5_9CAUD|nr:hypothetical protein QDA01_gp38 [Microbacterium phage Cinna]QDH91651.1 hypothetical protein PBI_CINNA_67 [Microbacterium phage Cinna]
MTTEPEHVPTAAELVKMGREYAIAAGYTGKGTKADPHKPTGIRILQKGHDLMGEVMRRNAARARGENPDTPTT